MPKRKAVEEAGPASGAAEASTAPGQAGKASKPVAKSRKAYTSIEATEALTQAREPNKTDKGNFDEWAEKIALHLATTPHFIQELAKSPKAHQVTVSTEFLADIYLPGRVNRFQSFQSFRNTWYAKIKDQVFERAKDIVFEVYDIKMTDIAKIQVVLPDQAMAATWTEPRQGLFKLHTTRLRLKDIVRNAINVQHSLADNLRDCITGSASQAKDKQREALVTEMSELEDLKEKCRAVLRNSTLDQAGIKILDQLLTHVDEQERLYETAPESYQMLSAASEIEESDVGETADADKSGKMAGLAEESGEAELDVLPADQIIDDICERYSFDTDYVDGREAKSWTTGVVENRRGMVKGAYTGLDNVGVLQGAKHVSLQELAELEDECARWLLSMSSAWASENFVLVFREFEKLKQRPAICMKAGFRDPMWEWQPTTRLEVIRDNMVHVRCLTAMLVSEGLLREEESGKESSLDQLQRTLRRMYALQALAFGASSEPGLLCTIMDRLLEDLAEQLVGHVDPKMETVRMQQVTHAIAVMRGTEQQAAHFLQDPIDTKDETVLAAMKQEQRARLLFSELARMYRGAIALSVAQTNGISHNSVKGELQRWLDEFMKWSAECGHPSCTEQLKVEKITYGAKQTRWSISVAVDDARIGFKEERAEISNRSQAYPCFWYFVEFMRFHAGLAPFYHYFTHLYHPSCRPFRGKAGLLDDITVMDQRKSKVSTEVKEGGDGAVEGIEGIEGQSVEASKQQASEGGTSQSGRKRRTIPQPEDFL